MSEEKKNKKIRFNPNRIVKIVIVILCLMLAVGLILHYKMENEDKPITAIGTQASAPADTPAPLDAQLTDINSNLYLVNKNTPSLDSAYEPADLTDPENVTSTSGVITLRAEAAGKLEEMVKAAGDAGVTLLVTSAYRSYNEQEQLYTSYSSLLKESEAVITCAAAGYSEHQLGLAADFTDSVDTVNQTESFADTAAGQWLSQHAHEYGFILRYPKDKQSVTGYKYMPWHYRYVGTDTANAMYAVSPDETMEEYFNVNK